MVFDKPLPIKDDNGNIDKIPFETIQILLTSNPQGNSQLKITPSRDIGKNKIELNGTDD